MKTKATPHPVTLKKMSGDPKFEIIDHKARLSKPKAEETIIVLEKSQDEVDKMDNVDLPDLSESNNNLRNSINDAEFEEVVLSPDYDIPPLEKINVEEFHKQQKLIEEQNRKRREMLSKALDDRLVISQCSCIHYYYLTMT